MYNLLIVDDEPILLASLREMISTEREKQFVVYAADSAYRAMEIFDSVRIDLLLTDIRMPGMSGLELLQWVVRRWPDCCTIFLTGHSEFDYVRQAIHPSIISYLLKTEGDDAILTALDTAYETLEDKYLQRSLRLEESLQLQEALPLLRKDCLSRMVAAEPIPLAERGVFQSKLHSYGIELDFDLPLLIAIALPGSGQKDITRLRMQRLVEDVLRTPLHAAVSEIFSDVLLIVAQATTENTPARLKGFLEIAHSLCVRAGMTQAQFYVSSEPCAFENLGQMFSSLYHRRFEISDNVGVSMCTAGHNLSAFTWNETLPAAHAFQLQSLQDSLISGDRDSFFLLLQQLVQDVGCPCPTVALTLFLTVSSQLLQAIVSFLPRESDILSHVSMARLANYSAHANFSEALYFLEHAAELYFSERQAVSTSTRERIVGIVNQYIQKNLSSDLSLSVLSGQVGLHPTYLSRIYRETTKQSINQFIAAQRIQAAQQLLAEPQLKINEIVERIGLTTASQFTHFFKKHVGMTPQEYRNTLLNTAKKKIPVE